MPIYEYNCSQCDHEFEKLVFSSSEKVDCPNCKSKKVSRKMSTFAFSSGGKFEMSIYWLMDSCSSPLTEPCC